MDSRWWRCVNVCSSTVTNVPLWPGLSVMGRPCLCEGRAVFGKSLKLLPNFTINLKPPLKSKVYLRDIHVENKCMNTKREKVSGMNREMGVDLYTLVILCIRASQEALVVKNPPANAGDTRDEGSISGSGRSPGKGNGTTVQYLGWKILQTRGVWRTTVHAATKSNWALYA